MKRISIAVLNELAGTSPIEDVPHEGPATIAILQQWAKQHAEKMRTIDRPGPQT